MAERVEDTVGNIVYRCMQRLGSIALQEIHASESTHGAGTYCLTMQRRGYVSHAISKLHEHFHELRISRDVRRNVEEPECGLVTVRHVRVHHVHHAGHDIAEVILGEELAETLVVGLTERRRGISSVAHEITQTCMIGTLNVAYTLCNAVSCNAVAAGTIEARRVHRPRIHLRIAHNLHTNDAVSGQSYFTVIELKIVKIVEAVLGKLPAGHEAVVRQHLDRSHIAGPEGQVSRRVVRCAGEPVQVKVRIDVRLFQNFKNILLDIGRKFRAVEQFFAGPQCPGEHASSTLCVRAVRRIGEVERADCAKYGKHLGVEPGFLGTPDETRRSDDIRAGEHRIRIHREILEKIGKGTTEPTLTALILDEKHHLIGSFLGLLLFPALQHGLGGADGIHHIPTGLENIHGQPLLQGTKDLILGFGRYIRTGRRENHPWELRGTAGEGIIQVGIGNAGLESSEVDRGIDAEDLHALAVGT